MTLKITPPGDKDLIPRFWFCVLFTFPFFVRRIDPTIQWLLATIVLVVGNWSFFQRAWTQKLSRYTLFSVSVTILYVYSLFEAFLAKTPQLLYGMAASVTVLILLEQLFEQHIHEKGSAALRKLNSKEPKKAHKLFVDGHTEEVAVTTLKEGDTVRVTPGDIVPVDGVIFSGEALVEESFISGSEIPVRKELGSAVYAAAKNLEGTCLVRAIRAGKQSLHSQMIEIARVALQSSSPLLKKVDKIASSIIFGLLVLSCVSFFFWSLFSDFANAALVVSSLCIAVCPCALVLAGSLVRRVAIGEAANQGIVIKSSSALEEVARCTILVVNKNGTLTVGKPVIASLDPVEGVSSDELLKIAASLEATSIHPFGRCIVEKAGILDEPLFSVDALQEVSGLGIKGKIDQQECLIGDEKLMQDIDLSYLKVRAEDMRKQGYIVLFCAKGQKLLGIVVLSDPIRRDVKDSVKAFKAEGFQLFCLSGDRRITIVQLVNTLGFDRFQAEAPTEQKIFTIKKLQKEGKVVLMVSDPATDSAALSQANAGVALGTKGNMLEEGAPITLLDPTLSSALRLLAFSKKTRQILNQNIVLSCGYMVVVFFMALFGSLGPSHGAFYMLLSTMVIGYNSLRLSQSSSLPS